MTAPALTEAPSTVQAEGAVCVSKKIYSPAHFSLEGRLQCRDTKSNVQKEGESFQLHILSRPKENKGNWLVFHEGILVFLLLLLFFQRVG